MKCCDQGLLYRLKECQDVLVSQDSSCKGFRGACTAFFLASKIPGMSSNPGEKDKSYCNT